MDTTQKVTKMMEGREGGGWWGGEEEVEEEEEEVGGDIAESILIENRIELL